MQSAYHQQPWYYPQNYLDTTTAAMPDPYPSPAPSDPSPNPRPHHQLDQFIDPSFAQIDSSIGPTRVSRRQPSSSAKHGLLPLRASYHPLGPSIQITTRDGSPNNTEQHYATPINSVHHQYPPTPSSMTSPYSPYEHARRSRTRSNSIFDPTRAPSPALSTASARTSLSSNHGGPGAPSSSYHRPESSSVRSSTARPGHRDVVVIKHTKHRLRDVDRKNICLHHLNNPHARQEDIGAVFNVERSTISKILKEKEKWLNITEEDESNAQTAKHRPSKFPEVEFEMVKSLDAWSEQGVNITDQLIRQRALEIARALHITPDRFKGSSGWIENFKHRHDIRRGEWLRAKGQQSSGLPPTPVILPYDERMAAASTSRSAQAHGPVHQQENEADAPPLPQQQQQWTPQHQHRDSTGSSGSASPTHAQPQPHGMVLDPVLQQQSEDAAAVSSSSSASAPVVHPPLRTTTHEHHQLSLSSDPSAIQHSPDGYEGDYMQQQQLQHLEQQQQQQHHQQHLDHRQQHQHQHLEHQHQHQHPQHHMQPLYGPGVMPMPMSHAHEPMPLPPMEALEPMEAEEIPLAVTGPPPPPTIQEAEDAMTTVITFLDTCGQEIVKDEERRVLTEVKCALFQFASGIPYERMRR